MGSNPGHYKKKIKSYFQVLVNFRKIKLLKVLTFTLRKSKSNKS